ncbi:class I SAM-dependent methyltransferase [Nonomuraea sp. NPDC050556]|uniref:class I SAM-dependent methyltransferase n=1 Tax=Nonomuraea sp. NPDC050556 TaxID=3364369 RepID=UPI0037B9962E
MNLYNLGYRLFRMPWELGPRKELVELVTSGRLPAGRAIDLGCGTGANSVFLAEHGFDVTGVDFAPAALVKARAKAAEAGVSVDFRRDDLTALTGDHGVFDLLVDYGTLDDLSPARRDLYVRNVLPLTRTGTRFLLWCFEWAPRRFDRWVSFLPIAPGEVAERFGAHFTIELLGTSGAPQPRRLVAGTAAYLLTRVS